MQGFDHDTEEGEVMPTPADDALNLETPSENGMQPAEVNATMTPSVGAVEAGVTPVPDHRVHLRKHNARMMAPLQPYEPFLPGSMIKTGQGEMACLDGNLDLLPRGPPFFKWTIACLLVDDMIKMIQEQAPLDAPKLKTLVRGIRPRVGARANPREGEPTDYVLVLGDIIQANDPKSKSTSALRTAQQMFDNGRLHQYKSACLCNIVHSVNGSVSLH